MTASRCALCRVVAGWIRGKSSMEVFMFRGAMLIAVAVALVAPATASAAKPAVTTGAAVSIGQATGTLNGKVDPNGKPTTYFFQIGTTRIYGSTTAVTS